MRNTAFPECLFFLPQNSEKETGEISPVFVQATGELLSDSRLVRGPPDTDYDLPTYTGNFKTVSFTNWPDKKDYDALEFLPPGFGAGGSLLHFVKGLANIEITQVCSLHAPEPIRRRTFISSMP